MKDFKILPSTGGYFDQDFLYMDIFNIIKNVHDKYLSEKR